MSEKEQKNEIVTGSGYSALARIQDMQGAMDELKGLEFTMDRVRIPAGGGTAFEVPGENEETDLAKDITGVIVHNHPAYAFYRDKYTGGNNPPDCGSFDGVKGTGCPGGECARCPNNAFGSGEGKSKACKNKRMLYVLPEGEFFPICLSLPSGSLKEFSQYAKRQLTRGRRISDVVTRITLKKATSSTGIAYSQAVFTMERLLTDEERKAIAPVIEDAREYASHLTVAALIPSEDEQYADPETGEVAEPLR